MNMKPNFYRKREVILDILYPKQCVCCNTIIDDSEELCDNCLRNIERIDNLSRCIKCGLEKADCQCKIYTYHFDGCVAPFYNKGIAKSGMYSFKFKNNEQYALFFAREMAKALKSQLPFENFDAVCFVPSAFHSFLKRGFNQSYLLAKHLSYILDVPLIQNSIKCSFSFGFQHNLNRIKRFERVQKKYSFKRETSYKLKNKKVLLVDDIKTTGATLDECSRQLLFSGARSVFCVTALITAMEKKENKKHK